MTGYDGEQKPEKTLTLSIFLTSIFFMAGNTMAEDMAVAPAKPWSLALEYRTLEDKGVFKVRQKGLITAPGGSTYTSSTDGEIIFEMENRGATLVAALPRKGVLQWEASVGSTGYDVWIPSGAYANRLSRSHGFTAGIAAGIEMLPETLVTPQVKVRFGWSLSRAQLGNLDFGESGASEKVEDRLDLQKKSLLFSAQKAYRQGRWIPSAGFEIFRLDSELVNLRNGESASGGRQGFRLAAKLSAKISSSELLSLEGSVGDEKGFRLSLTQGF